MTLPLQGCRILWVDDQPASIVLPLGRLRQEGAEVVLARTNDEALELAASEVIDLVVADIAHPGAEEGSELGIRLAASGVHVPVIHFVGRLEPGRPPPAGSIAITNDDGELLELIREALHR